MPVFAKDDIDKIASCLKAVAVTDMKDCYRLKIFNDQERRGLSLEIYPETSLGTKKKGAMVVVYLTGSHLQLHNLSGFVISEELGEVTFVGEAGGRIAGLVVEREAACSLYANVNRELISSDFTKFGVEVMLSGVALSLAEDLLQEG
jgi:hypothetical protein